jgi:hypothetical protein
VKTKRKRASRAITHQPVIELRAAQFRCPLRVVFRIREICVSMVFGADRGRNLLSVLSKSFNVGPAWLAGRFRNITVESVPSCPVSSPHTTLASTALVLVTAVLCPMCPLLGNLAQSELWGLIRGRG